ncbi:DUF3592 domain-containing protein [Streptomyces glomeratus]|uniref:DUF3592 domain-containing protein n=1 Tax=Streptomyces glomeratus TaxID=284452 RepID=A0ABP6M506_9ACTN|nr:DUF3592 domain-containing protein [Streptomyces glomeratus]MCF1511430.1 DUF3592 domain-containing protein [Streptomyces glomeratus]
MDFFFYAMPGLIMAGALAMAAKVVRRSLQLRSNWTSGLTAEARCLRTYSTTSGGGDTSVTTTLHHVYEFSTREGRTVRFEEANGPSTTVEGDIVPVHYTQAHPERATAHSPAPGKALAGTVGILVFLSVIVAFCVGFMVTYHAFTTDGLFANMP